MFLIMCGTGKLDFLGNLRGLLLGQLDFVFLRLVWWNWFHVFLVRKVSESLGGQ